MKIPIFAMFLQIISPLILVFCGHSPYFPSIEVTLIFLNVKKSSQYFLSPFNFPHPSPVPASVAFQYSEQFHISYSIQSSNQSSEVNVILPILLLKNLSTREVIWLERWREGKSERFRVWARLDPPSLALEVREVTAKGYGQPWDAGNKSGKELVRTQGP